MLILISPAKTLDFSVSTPDIKTTLISFPEETSTLVEGLKKLKPKDFQNLMGISPKL
ncbi:MAG TPA: peroxide stress protein YaaA, partial [Bacteroidales bacterium]|nr:peroxide stress protein YaaA [Bacteroidales bacterium]